MEPMQNYNIKENEEKEFIDNLTIMSLGKEEYERFVKKIGGKYEDYKDGAILIDNSSTYNGEGNREEGNLYTWKKGDIITGTIAERTENLDTDEGENIDTNTEKKKQSIKIVEKTNERPMGLEEIYSNTGFLIVSDEYIEKIGYMHINSIEINAKDSFNLEDEIRQFYKSKNMSENDNI